MTRVLPDGRIEFRCFRPDAGRVKLAGTFSDWKPLVDLMREESTQPGDTSVTYTGHWSARLNLPSGPHAYGFEVDGRMCCDLSAPAVEIGVRSGRSGISMTPVFRPMVSAVSAPCQTATNGR